VSIKVQEKICVSRRRLTGYTLHFDTKGKSGVGGLHGGILSDLEMQKVGVQ